MRKVSLKEADEIMGDFHEDFGDDELCGRPIISGSNDSSYGYKLPLADPATEIFFDEESGFIHIIPKDGRSYVCDGQGWIDSTAAHERLLEALSSK